MKTSTIYLVVCAGGHYDDAFHCNVAAFTDRIEAERFVEVAQSYVTEENERHCAFDWSLSEEGNQKELDRIKAWRSPIDPDLRADYHDDAEYHIETVELQSV